MARHQPLRILADRVHRGCEEDRGAQLAGRASGPFSQQVAGLAASASYSFRVCGSDEGGLACAQTRTFTTSPAIEDSAEGTWGSTPCCIPGKVDATSGPAGESARGTLSYHSAGNPTTASFTFTGFVTCLAVDGRRAAIGAVGHLFTTPPGETTPATALVTLVDGHATDWDSVGIESEPGSTPPDCAGASFDDQSPYDSFWGRDFVVNDADFAPTR
jgi:hypothetical protein